MAALTNALGRPPACTAASSSWPLQKRAPLLASRSRGGGVPAALIGAEGRSSSVAARARRGASEASAPPPAKTADCYIGFDAGGGYYMSPPPCSGPSCVGVGLFAAAAASFGAALWFKGQQWRQQRQRQHGGVGGGGGGGGAGGYAYARRRGAAPEPWPEIPSAEDDPDGYRLALARTRQAQHVSRASALTRAGDPARAMVELRRALHENESCRSPLLDGHHTDAQLHELYVLFVQNSPTVPPPFAHLLQLRGVLGLGERVAEELEAQALREAAAFSI